MAEAIFVPLAATEVITFLAASLLLLFIYLFIYLFIIFLLFLFGCVVSSCRIASVLCVFLALFCLCVCLFVFWLCCLRLSACIRLVCVSVLFVFCFPSSRLSS